jgi:hypothetical protein
MTSEALSQLDRIGFRSIVPIEQDIFKVALGDYGKIAAAKMKSATGGSAGATDYYSASLSQCSLTEFVDDFVIQTYTPLSPLGEFLTVNSRGSWLPTMEVRKKGKPSISAIQPACCGLKPGGVESPSGFSKFDRTSIAAAVEICDLDKWVSSDSSYRVDLEGEAMADRLEALTEVQGMLAIRGGFGLKGIRGNTDIPAVYLSTPLSSFAMEGSAIVRLIINIIRHTDPNYTPPGGYTLALPPQTVRALDVPYSDTIADSVRSILMGTCTCTIPGIRPGIIGDIVEMPHLSCAAEGMGTGDMGLLYVPEFLFWDLPVPYQIIEPDRCGLVSIGAVVSHVGEVVQKRLGHMVKIFNV